jgi:hypothetical protein
MSSKMSRYIESLEEKKRSLERTKPTVIELHVSPSADFL